MKKMVFVLAAALLLIAGTVFAQSSCNTIQGGLITASDGTAVETGYDDWGYNYQARIFNSKYCDFNRNATDCPYINDDLEMKWNDAWMSNKDCNYDGKLDRHYGYPSYIGSGAWLTNHQKGVYTDTNGKKQRWTYFVKIVAVPTDAKKVGATWFTADDMEIGPVTWGEFATIQEVYNDTGTGEHGILYHSPYSSGFGKFGPRD